MQSYQEDYQKSITTPDKFWLEQARQIHWHHFPSRGVTQVDDIHYRWFEDGQLNTAYLALDYHVKNGRGEQKALIYDSPVTQTQQFFTYRELMDEVARFAGVLNRLGVKKGERIVIYMPMIPQTVIAMLACARIGAIHSVVFGGFAARELAIRIDSARPKLLLTASCGIEGSKQIPYLPLVEAALQEAENKPEASVVYQREVCPAQLSEGLVYDWETLVREQKEDAPVCWMQANDPLYILYTSGTTGKPKGIVRDHGGHAVALKYSMDRVYDCQPGEVYWAASDVGWVVGHSYIVYGPLIQGCTTVLYEGKPIKTPDAGAFWRVIAEHQVNVFFTAPTAIRAIRKADPRGDFKKAYPTPSLKAFFLAGERCDVSTYHWSTELLKVPVIDHWWQTESGWAMLANMTGYGVGLNKPGSAGRPVCGYDIRIMDKNGRELPTGEEGDVVVKLPLPPACLNTLWDNEVRFRRSYFDQYPGYFLSGDGGYKDEDGFVFITGRMDDVINVAGHRLSTADIEEIVAAHPAVAECAVIGIADQLKGQVPVGLVVIKGDNDADPDQLQAELVASVRQKLGPIVCFRQSIIVDRLPKTRSGKILRTIMRSIADGKSYAPPSTIEDMSVLGEIENRMEENQLGEAFS